MHLFGVCGVLVFSFCTLITVVRRLIFCVQVALLVGGYTMKAYDFLKSKDAEEGWTKKLTVQVEDGESACSPRRRAKHATPCHNAFPWARIAARSKPPPPLASIVGLFCILASIMFCFLASIMFCIFFVHHVLLSGVNHVRSQCGLASLVLKPRPSILNGGCTGG